MAATVVTIEFGTIHYYSILEEILMLVCSFLWTDTKLTQHYVNCDIFGLEQPCFKQQHECN